MKQKLWLRRLSCGHERLTNIAYLVGDYTKPIVGSCYCRICLKNTEIISVMEIKIKETGR